MSIRHIPVHWETSYLSPSSWNYTASPGHSSYSSYSSSYGGNTGGYTRPTTTYAPVTPPFPTDPFPLDARERRIHFDDRSSTQFNNEVQKMNRELARMSDNMSRNVPVATVDDWRLTENFRNDNPIVQDVDGFRRFRLKFDVRQFRPEEIHIKTSGNQLSIHAKHEDKDPSGKSTFREYSRQYILPREVSPEMLSSKLAHDGTLTVEAPLPALEGPRDKTIPILRR